MSRPGTYTKEDLLIIAARLACEPSTGHPWIDARKQAYLDVVAPLLQAERRSKPEQISGVKDAHLATTRAWRSLLRQLHALRSVPWASAEADTIIHACFPGGIAFTQTPSERQIDESRRILPKVEELAESRTMRRAGLPRAVEAIRLAVAAHEAAWRATGASNRMSKQLLRECNSAIHRYARLVSVCSGVELTKEDAGRLLLLLDTSEPVESAS